MADPFENWYDISSEVHREYVNGSGDIYRIESPQKLFLNKISGTHYILDSEGVVHTLRNSAFMACRFLDKNGVSFTSTQSGDTARVKT